MSIKLMSAAWHIDLPSSPKLLLMALADIADDVGVCWPSVGHLAKKCSMSERTVRTHLVDLERGGCLRIERRFREDGSQSSNQYVVFPKVDPLGGHAAPQEKSAVTRTHPLSGPAVGPCKGAADLAGPSQTSLKRQDDDAAPVVAGSPLVAPRGCAGPQSGGVVPHSPLNRQMTPTRNQQQPQPQLGSVHGDSYVFPPGVSEPDKAHAATILQVFDFDTGQLILDELAGRARRQPVGNWRGYLRELVARAVDGRFTPELGPQERSDRDIRAKNLAVLAQHDQSLRERPAKVNLDALSPRLRAILAKRVFGADAMSGESEGTSSVKGINDGQPHNHRSTS